MSIEQLLAKLNKIDPESNNEIVRKAYVYAKKKHAGQMRLSGESYIAHPQAVAEILVELGLDDVTIAAALLHDVIEDTDTKNVEIEQKFGRKVAELVDGVTTLGEIDFSRLPSEDVQEVKFKAQIESLRKFFLAMAKDVRVVVIKLADRLHNMRTLDALSPADQKRVSRETLEIFAPLADRLGMGNIKAELEDLAFKYSNPDGYRRIEKLMQEGERERKNYLSHIKRVIINELAAEGIKAEIDGRAKHLYSTHNKLEKVGGDISKVYDLMAVRVMVDTVEECYKALGIIHKRFKPLIYRIKDYIAVPKPNGYQSLHTTVFGLRGKITEIQIRTHEMHEEAEKGVAAHWYYGEKKLEEAYRNKPSFAPQEHIDWVSKIMDWQKNIKNMDDFAESLKIDLFNDRIFAFTPEGKIVDLPEGATPVDFAYEIHSLLGNRCRGAKVNGRIVPLDYQLVNRDVVEILTAPKKDVSGPNRGWLEFVKTAKAKQRIRSWFRRQNREENIREGDKLLSAELSIFNLKEVSEAQQKKIIDTTGWRSWDDVLAAIGDGSIMSKHIVRRIIGQKIAELEKETKKTKPTAKSSPSSLAGIVVRYAECCKPKKGDPVKGYITKGYGITIHRADCGSLLTSAPERIIEVDFTSTKKIKVKVEISGKNRVGLIRDVTDLIAKEKLIVDDLKAHNPRPDTSLLTVAFTLDDPSTLSDLIKKIREVDGIERIKQV
jgi:guanosine-3',5'-bis(diphosphate) 3'-pyrophosphohydrolase